ncbi:uncharacterized protein LOC141902361 [Tubulanus polymorphus]|uniref:uncharacterized protein LOC141902361 n=1 Tax=Tubulanus polymorphus TaxID=672921 RepID=UPI003DA2FF9A
MYASFYRVLLLLVYFANGAMSQCPRQCRCNMVLTWIDCRDSRILNISSNWSIFRTATYLDLSQNLISDIREFPRNKLVHLVLFNNSISTIGNGSMKNASNLMNLNLGYNDISTLNRDGFVGLWQLKILSLTHNKLKTIRQIDLHHLVRLEDLDLSHNMIKFITERAFIRLPELSMLNVSHNYIHRLHDDWFNEKSNLKMFNISHNKIDTLIGRPFRNLHNLTSLDLRCNHINGITRDTFAKQRRLENVYLQHNRIYSIEENSFNSSWKQLSIVDVSDNLLSFLPKRLLPWSRLDYLNLTNNTWTCDCDVLWMKDLPSTAYLVCSAPRYLRGVLIVDVEKHLYCSSIASWVLLGTLVPVSLIFVISTGAIARRYKCHRKRRENASSSVKYEQYRNEGEQTDFLFLRSSAIL